MALSRNSQLVQQALQVHGFGLEVVELDASTRTAHDAAAAVGCELGQIVKSLVFRSGDNALLFLVSGRNQLNVGSVSTQLGMSIEKADANFAREKSGFPIGGVPPVAHASPMATYIDRTLLDYEQVWAAAGTPNSIFKLESRLLPELTGGLVIDVT